ncbi:hypothetical protein LXH09_37265 [Streptomyces sp. CS7]|uniref:hypothetical protein n=1 Tax=Streptomyces sp. CS-7 TaxID=2906769 RepID=UPI0021B3D63E|nr:hypothetical protein [Streptomyces sp. CS-7]MCT6782275.1 hypothetical protein [Streptomyces sp. CS-7]
MTSLDVERWDEDYEPAAGLHITYKTGVFTTAVEADQWLQQPGYTVHLREGAVVLAKVELLGSAWDARATADEISLDTSPDHAWLPTLRTLSRALRTDHHANAFDRDLGQLLSWRYGTEDPDGQYTSYDEHDRFEQDAARSAKARLTRHVPAGLQAELPLTKATETHIGHLRARATELRATAVREMPNPATTPRPQQWIADYTPLEARQIKALDPLNPLRPWLADLPHRLLRCWKDLPPQEKEAIGTGRRDALVRWAQEWDLPKTAASRASGLARTTIDRILKP